MAVMGSWVFRLLVIGSAFSVFWGDIEVGCYAEGEKDHLVNFITWDDMKVDLRKQRLDWREDKYNKSRVIVIDQSGHGDSVTVQGAVDMVPMHNSERVKIYILPGIYREKVFIPDSKPYISIIGVENLLVCREKVFIPDSKPYISIIGVENRTSETIITWNDKASDKEKDGSELGTYRSASVAIESDFFCATGITIENSVVAVPGAYGNQAVALRISGNKAMFYRVRILGTQDTLLDDCGSHYFYQCYIQGSIDFVFGSSRSLYQDCVLHSTAKRYGAIAAHYRDSQEDDTGFSFVNCTINGTGTVYLGRAWGNYSRAIYSYCDIDNVVTPSGWSDWNQPSRQKTAVFGEFQCRGKGADRRKRVAWSKSFSYEEVKPFLDMTFISGDKWLRL